MKLSFCIPTYNRCQFLKKNIDIIINQIRELSVENDVEILINDNASPDNTEELCKEYIVNNPDIHIEFYKNETNEGPDWNFIKAMRLAHGEYSILFGDDDFLMPGSLGLILKMISNDKADLFLTNRTSIDTEGNIIKEQTFIYISSSSKLFSFTEEDAIRSYFYGVRTLGGVLTFISSVVYKTKLVYEHSLDESVIGSNYAFLYFWWSSLKDGATLKYYNRSLIYATTLGATNNNYGKRIDRVLVDYKGLLTIANCVFENIAFRNCFLRAIDIDHSIISLQTLYRISPKEFNRKLEPYLLATSWDKNKLAELKQSSSASFAIRIIAHRIISRLSNIIRN